MCCSYSYWFQFYCFQPWGSILSGIFKKNMTINYSSSSITRVEEAETHREREREREVIGPVARLLLVVSLDDAAKTQRWSVVF